MLIKERQQATNQAAEHLSALEQNGMGGTMNVNPHLVD